MKKMLLLVLSFAALGGLAYGQNYVEVAPGEGSLSAAIVAANDGDILRLVPDAEYTESTLKTIGTVAEKSIAIVTDGDGSIKARVLLLTDPAEGTCQFFNVGNNGSLLVAGLELNGNGTASYLARTDAGDPPIPTAIKKIHFESCVIMNLKSNVIDGANSKIPSYVVVDSTVINNCIVHDTGTLVHYKYAASNYIRVTNSTIYNMTSYGMRIAGYGYTMLTETPEVHVDHTTWHNMGLTDPREIILAEKGLTSYFQKPWYITNSIFSTQISFETSSKTAINIKETLNDNMATISNICMWQLSAKKNWLSHTVKDTIRMDPGFADPANGDFTIPAGSILLTYGNDGGPVGDKRWTNNASAVETDAVAPPADFFLEQNYPNPFNPSTTIAFVLPVAGMVNLAVYDALGREVAILAQGMLEAGSHRYQFSAQGLCSGLYLCRLTAAGQTWTRKMLLMQ